MGCSSCGGSVSINVGSGGGNRAVQSTVNVSPGRVRATDTTPRAVLAPDARVAMIKKAIDNTKANVDALKKRVSETANVNKKSKK